jgi:hypothetical protein
MESLFYNLMDVIGISAGIHDIFTRIIPQVEKITIVKTIALFAGFSNKKAGFSVDFMSSKVHE